MSDLYKTHLEIIEFVLDNCDIKKVIEFGPGNYSTDLFVKKQMDLVSVEQQSLDWYKHIKTSFPKISLFYEPDLEYTFSRFKMSYNQFDLVFIDGHEHSRAKLVNMATKKTKIIICHDTEPRNRHIYDWDIVDTTIDGWEWIDIKNSDVWTSVFTSDDKLKQKLKLQFDENQYLKLKEHPGRKISINVMIGLACNFKCSYCCNGSDYEIVKDDLDDLVKCILDLSKVYEVEVVNFAGGEPLLWTKLPDILKELTNNHINVSMVSNLSVDINKVLIGCDREYVIIYPSLHMKELKTKKLQNMFIDNYNLINRLLPKPQLASIVAHPDIISNFEDEIKIYKDAGVDFYFTPYRGKHSNKIYPNEYSKDELIFFKIDKYSEEATTRCNGQLCTAGFNSIFINTKGFIYPCIDTSNLENAEGLKFGHVSDSIQLFDELISCPAMKCGCKPK